MTHHIKSLLGSFIKTHKDWKRQLLEKWPEIMGPLADTMHIEKIYDDTIILGVSDSCWLQELYLLSQTILTTINQNLDQPRIKQIRFKQVLHRPKTMPIKKEFIERKTIEKPLTREEEVALSRIKDVSLKQSLHAFLTRCKEERS